MSIIKHPEQRVGVFIDTQNVYHSAKNLFHSRANFGNILMLLQVADSYAHGRMR
jgi:hypothetical protein